MAIAVDEPQNISRSGDTYVITIPADVVERHGLKPDDLVRVQLELIDVVPRVAPDLQGSLAYALEGSEEALRYLRDHWTIRIDQARWCPGVTSRSVSRRR